MSIKTPRLFVPAYSAFAEKDVYRRHLVVGERAVARGSEKALAWYAGGHWAYDSSGRYFGLGP